jgi:hypothetical protein
MEKGWVWWHVPVIAVTAVGIKLELLSRLAWAKSETLSPE